jgi:hypothetical protein
MSSQKHIQDELRSLESSLPFNNTHPYRVPEGYFEGLAAILLAKVKSIEVSAVAELEEISPLLAGIPKVNPYSVPSSYFEQTAKRATQLLGETESPILESIGKTLPYRVPQGYFDTLPEDILRKAARPKAKVVPLFARPWMRMAVAAALIGALFFGGYQLLRTGGTEPPVITAQHDVPDTNQSLASTEPAIVKEIKQASTKDLEEFINNVQVNPAKVPNGENPASDRKEVEELLKDVTITEMESFLAAIPTADDDLLVTD